MTDDLGETVQSVANAAKSVSDTTCKGIELTERVLGWLAKMLGEDAAGLLKDTLFFWRAKNALSLQDKIDRELAQRGIANPRPIPLRLAIPFFETATLEDDATLQERWARLLTNAMDPTFTGTIEKCFGRILEEFSPFDCLVLETLAARVGSDPEFTVNSLYLADQLATSERYVSVALGNLRRLELVHNMFLSSTDRPVRHDLTDFGLAFLEACAPVNPGDGGQIK